MAYSVLKLKGWKLPIVAAIGLFFAIFMVVNRPSKDVKPLEVTPPKAEFISSISGIGVVEPKSEVISIGVDLPGVVRQVFVEVGQDVAIGDPVFALDQRDIDSEIKILEAKLVKAEISARDAKSQFEIYKNTGTGKAISKNDYDRKKYADLLASANLEEINYLLEQAYVTKDRLMIRAPISGKILEIDVRPGEYASVTMPTAPLVKMGDVSSLYVRVEIDEENSAYITSKSKANGYKRGNTTKSIPLKFVRFEPLVKPKQNLAVIGQRVDTRVLQAIYSLPQDINNIYVGQQMDVFIERN